MSLTRIVLGGEGGQGVQTVAEILAEAGHRSGLEALYIPNFGVEQRGGVSLAFVQLGDETIAAPKFKKAQAVVALSDRAIKRTADYVTKDTTFIYEASAAFNPSDLPREAGKLLPIPAVKLATEHLHPRVFNIVILGVVVGVVDMLKEEALKEALEDRLGYRFVLQPELRELNYRALDEGREVARQSVGEGAKLH